MAVDTRDNRFSMMGFAQPTLSLMADPDGSIDAAGRAQMLFLYAGIELAGAATPCSIFSFDHSFTDSWQSGAIPVFTDDRVCE